MGRFSFRIGTKLGLTAGVGVALVAGMLASQIMGNQSIADLSTLVVINMANKANAQAADAAMLRMQIDVQEIGGAASPERLQAGVQWWRAA